MRRPGFDTRLNPPITRSRSVVYLSLISSTFPGWPGSSLVSKPSMYPSRSRMAARDSFSLELGMRTLSCMATLALRTRVSMSAIGSVMVIGARLLSPARLRDAGDLAGVHQLAQADPAQAELPEHRVRSPAPAAPGVGPHLELRRALLFLDQCLLRHLRLTALRVGTGTRRPRAELGLHRRCGRSSRS